MDQATGQDPDRPRAPWLINPRTGQIVFWTAEAGIDGQTPIDLDQLDLACIDPLPSSLVPGHGRLLRGDYR